MKIPHQTNLGVESLVVPSKVWESRVGGNAETGPWGSSAGICGGTMGTQCSSISAAVRPRCEVDEREQNGERRRVGR